MTSQRTLFFELHRRIVAVTAWPELGAALQARLSAFRREPPDGPSDLTFVYSREAALAEIRRPATARLVYEPPGGEVLYEPGEDSIYISHESRIRAVCNGRSGRVLVAAEDPGPEELWLLSHPLFTLPLVELLKRRQLYALHAAALARDGAGLLLAGTSGAGKSTLTVALLGQGLDFLGDDTVFLTKSQDAIELLAFPDEVDLTDQTVAMLPELTGARSLAKPPGWRKYGLRAEEAFDRPVAWRCAPAMLVFPQIEGTRPESVLVPIPPDEALLELAPNVLLTEALSARAHFESLAMLARQAPAYRLHTGRDLARAARLLLEQLDDLP